MLNIVTVRWLGGRYALLHLSNEVGLKYAGGMAGVQAGSFGVSLVVYWF
jgi:hypothetical protein